MKKTISLFLVIIFSFIYFSINRNIIDKNNPENEQLLVSVENNGNDLVKSDENSTKNIDTSTKLAVDTTDTSVQSSDIEQRKNNNRKLLVKTDDNENYFEIDSVGNYYINDNKIDFSYEFSNSVSNSEGTINTYINLIPGNDFNIDEDWFGFIDFTTDFFGSKSTDKVLMITLSNIHSAKVDRYASGSYSDSTNYNYEYAKVIIDSSTGEIIDILEPNYYYEYGNQTYEIIKDYINIYP